MNSKPTLVSIAISFAVAACSMAEPDPPRPREDGVQPAHIAGACAVCRAGADISFDICMEFNGHTAQECMQLTGFDCRVGCLNSYADDLRFCTANYCGDGVGGGESGSPMSSYGCNPGCFKTVSGDCFCGPQVY